MLSAVTILATCCRARGEKGSKALALSGISEASGASEASEVHGGAAAALLSSVRVVALADTLLAADTVHLGRLHEGEQVRLPLAVENRSARPLVVAEVRSGCGCLDLEVAPAPIPSGGRAAAVLKFDARGLWGWQFKLLELHPAGAQPVRRVFVEAEIE